MGEEGGIRSGSSNWPPIGAPLLSNFQRDADPWRSNFDDSVNAVSFGFVATAILISMFLVMAIFERFLRPPGNTSHNTGPPQSASSHADLESQLGFNPKLGHPSPKVSHFLLLVLVLSDSMRLCLCLHFEVSG